MPDKIYCQMVAAIWNRRIQRQMRRRMWPRERGTVVKPVMPRGAVQSTNTAFPAAYNPAR